MVVPIHIKVAQITYIPRIGCFIYMQLNKIIMCTISIFFTACICKCLTCAYAKIMITLTARSSFRFNLDIFRAMFLLVSYFLCIFSCLIISADMTSRSFDEFKTNAYLAKACMPYLFHLDSHNSKCTSGSVKILTFFMTILHCQNCCSNVVFIGSHIL